MVGVGGGGVRREPDLYVLSKCVVLFAMLHRYNLLQFINDDKRECISFYDIPNSQRILCNNLKY